MKSNQKFLTILALIALPTLALAGGDHADAHGAHAMPGMAMDDHATLGGMPGDPAKVNQTIALEMNDAMRFTPDKVSVKAGETVRFYVVNKGKIAHEMVLGTADEISEHAEMMRKMPNMVHQEPNQIRLEPGQRGAIVWKFTKAGTMTFACLVPGHREAGMVGTVAVN